MADQDSVLFDVGVLALSHAATPVSDNALDPLKSALRGEITGIIPNPAILGAHHVLRNYYRISRDAASELMSNILPSREIIWYDQVNKSTLHFSLNNSAQLNIEAWDCYYAQVAKDTDVDKILTLDDDFNRVNGVDFEIVLEQNEFQKLKEFVNNISEIRAIGDLE